MDLFYTYKPQIQSANLESQSEMLLEIGKKIAAKKLKKIEKALKTKFNVSTKELDQWRTGIRREIYEAVAFA